MSKIRVPGHRSPIALITRGALRLDDGKAKQQQVPVALLAVRIGVGESRKIMGLVVVLQHELQHRARNVVVNHEDPLVLHRP